MEASELVALPHRLELVDVERPGDPAAFPDVVVHAVHGRSSVVVG